jgi:hypothetical protein
MGLSPLRPLGGEGEYSDSLQSGDQGVEPDQTHHSAADRPEDVAAPIGPDTAAEALRNGPIGALVVASVAVALLFVGWLAFYFLLFLPRGPIG